MSDLQARVEPTGMKKHMPYLFAFTAFCQGFGTVLVLQYLSFFVTEFMGMSLASLALILSGCTFADYIFTIVTGPIIQKTMTKWGQFRPYIITCPFVIVAGYTVIFYGFKASDLVMGILIAGCYGATGFAWQCLSASNNGLLSKVAGASAENRLSITSKVAVGARLAGLFTSMITAPFIKMATDNNFNGYLVLTLAYGFLTILPNIFLFFMTREYDVYNPDFRAPQSTSNVKVSEMYIDTLKNPHFLALFISAVVSGVGAQMVSPLNTYYFRFSVGNLSLMALSGTISVFVGIAAAAVMPPVARRLGKKRSAVITRYIAFVINVLIAFFTDGNFVAKVVLVSINSFAGAIFAAWGINMYLDVAEYQQWKTGKDMRAFVMSMSNMTARLGAVLGTPLAPFILANSGYDPVTGTFADTFRMCLFIGLAPAITSLLSGLIYQFGYRLTDEQAIEYAQHNQKMAEEKAAAEKAAAENAAAG